MLIKVQGNCRETEGKLQNTFFRPRKVQENCRETGGKLKNTFLRPKKVQGNWGETQKINFQA